MLAGSYFSIRCFATAICRLLSPEYKTPSAPPALCRTRGRKATSAVPPLVENDWWSWRDSNPRPPHCQCDALPLRHSPDRSPLEHADNGRDPGEGYVSFTLAAPGRVPRSLSPAHTSRRLSRSGDPAYC